MTGAKMPYRSRLARVYGQIAAVKAALAPYTFALTPRNATLKMGGKSLAFVEKTCPPEHVDEKDKEAPRKNSRRILFFQNML